MFYKYSYYNIVLKENDEFVYLYNSYSGALCKLEKTVHDYILNTVLDDKNKCNFFDKLLSQGFIKPLDLDEYNRIILNERVAVLSYPKRTLSYVIAPTLACNLNCDYCFESGYRNSKIISDEKIIEIANYIISRLSDNIDEIHIGWFGGEPLVAYEQIIKFSEYLIPKLEEKQIKYSASMISNGVLLTQDKAKILYEKCKINQVQITIDGTKQIYCTRKRATEKQFDDLLENIKSALEYLKITIRLNCDCNNYDDLKTVTEQLLRYCNNHKNLIVYLAKLVDYTSCGGEQFFSQDKFDQKRIDFDKFVCQHQNKPYEPLVYKYRKSFCGLYKLNNQVIGPDGEIYKCEHHVGQTDKIVGNIEYGLNYSDFLMKFIANEPLEQCKSCKIFPICLGGCPAQKVDLPEGQSCFFSQYYIEHILKQYIATYQNKTT